MPVYKGTNEVTSGNLYKGSTEIQDGYKATDSFYVNETSISFLNFPGVSDYVITGVPGDAIPGNRYQQWTVSANSGFAFNGTQTATGLPTDFSFSAGSQGSISNTTTSPRVNYAPSVFPSTSVSVDYNNLTISLPQTQIVTYSYTFTGNLGRSTSCTTFSGSSCGVSSSTSGSSQYGTFRYFDNSASGSGGYGAGGCTQGCSLSISSSGGSSSCNTVSGTSTASISGAMIGCGQLNTYGVAADTRSSGPSCAHGNNIQYIGTSGSTSVTLANLTPNNSGNYNQYVLSPSASNNYSGYSILGYAKGVVVGTAYYGGGAFNVSANCGN